MSKVICINSSNKPSKVPIEQWVKEGEIYTVIEVANMGLQPGKLGVLLKEVQMSADCFPYEYYDINRFVPVEDESVKKNVEEHVEEEEFSIL